MQQHQSHNDERRWPEYEKRERQGAGGYGSGHVLRNQAWDRDQDWEPVFDRRPSSYGYRPPRSYDWWGDISRPYVGRGPKGYQRSDERIREEVCDRLTIHPTIDASDIEVEVQNGEVILKGTVENRAIKRLVETMAETVSGVRDIHNQLRVNPQRQLSQTYIL